MYLPGISFYSKKRKRSYIFKQLFHIQLQNIKKDYCVIINVSNIELQRNIVTVVYIKVLLVENILFKIGGKPLTMYFLSTKQFLRLHSNV